MEATQPPLANWPPLLRSNQALPPGRHKQHIPGSARSSRRSSTELAVVESASSGDEHKYSCLRPLGGIQQVTTAAGVHGDQSALDGFANSTGTAQSCELSLSPKDLSKDVWQVPDQPRWRDFREKDKGKETRAGQRSSMNAALDKARS